VPSPPSIDLERGWLLDPRVALRPERFGALAYDFRTRRLTFLKTRVMHDVVRGLDGHASAREACLAAGVAEAELPRYAEALASLAESGMILPRTDG
jgi:putative mycofactocin binding protein MftB